MTIVNLKNNLLDLVQQATEEIKKGEVVILAFDTVYGFVCDPKNDQALQKIFDLKNRPLDKTIGLTADNIEHIKEVAELSSDQELLIRSKTPGRFTFIVKIKPNSNISSFCTRNETIAIRIPDSDLVRKIADQFGGVLAQTSANISGEENCYSVNDLEKQYGSTLNNVSLIIDGGTLRRGGASEIIDLTGEEPKLIERS